MKYNKKVMENFFNPKNFGEIKNPDAIGKVGNVICGDVMWIYLKIEKKGNKDYIKDIKFKTMGCAAAIATSSMITQLAKGKTIQEAENLTSRNVYDSLDELPPIKAHCATLAEQALKNALKNYKSKNKK